MYCWHLQLHLLALLDPEALQIPEENIFKNSNYYYIITVQNQPTGSLDPHSRLSPFLLSLQEALVVLVYPCPPNKTHTDVGIVIFLHSLI